MDVQEIRDALERIEKKRIGDGGLTLLEEAVIRVGWMACDAYEERQTGLSGIIRQIKLQLIADILREVGE